MITKRFALVAALACLVQAGAAHASRNACELLTKKDIAAVQGQAFTNAKLTEQNDNAPPTSQCFYQLPAFTKSVSVTVMRPRSASEYWKSHFANAVKEDDEDRDKKKPEEAEESPALLVGGVGERAVWTGNRLAGALYILHGNEILRISVGGSGSRDQKIAKSKRLAARTLKRL